MSKSEVLKDSNGHAVNFEDQAEETLAFIEGDMVPRVEAAIEGVRQAVTNSQRKEAIEELLASVHEFGTDAGGMRSLSQRMKEYF